MNVTDETINDTSKITACPACGLDSYYWKEMDRYIHINGIRNDACWAHISSGEHDWFAPSAFDLENPGGRFIKVTRGSDIAMRAIRWWEPGIVLADSINLLAGREGKGKSTVAASWAARETHGGGTVLWIGTEESREHAVTPRLKASGADLSKVLFFDVETAGITTSLQLPLDLLALEAAIVEHKITMIVMDPCKGLVPPDFRGNDDVAVRQYLEPIAALCARRNVVMIGLMHFGKREDSDSGKLILGSVAWSQVARSVISIAEDEEAGTRIITNTKANYSPEAKSLEFRIVAVDVTTEDGISTLGAVEWIGETTKDARDLLGGQDAGDEPGGNPCQSFVYDYIYRQGGEADAGEAIKAGRAAGFTEQEIKDARRRHRKPRIVSRKASFGDGWVWAIDAAAPEGGTDSAQGGTKVAKVADSRVQPPSPPSEVNLPPSQDPPGAVTASTPGQTDRVKAALAKAQQTMNAAPDCLVCGQSVAAGQGDTHLSCKGVN